MVDGGRSPGDVVDVPVPGVVRVTEVETTRFTLPDSDEENE